ncbi:MAG: hypothetical protein M3010_11505, partial [Candidatus Dormibacteraeota bacterium]|nr:hypothetical protein [Candidatus Dormibacteraeota bacterium]
FQGAFWLGDPQSGKGFSATLWDSADAAEQSGQLAAELREKMTGSTGVEVKPVGVFEVVARAETPA